MLEQLRKKSVDMYGPLVFEPMRYRIQTLTGSSQMFQLYSHARLTIMPNNKDYPMKHANSGPNFDETLLELLNSLNFVRISSPEPFSFSASSVKPMRIYVILVIYADD